MMDKKGRDVLDENNKLIYGAFVLQTIRSYQLVQVGAHLRKPSTRMATSSSHCAPCIKACRHTTEVIGLPDGPFIAF